jgi:hypothetical protein
MKVVQGCCQGQDENRVAGGGVIKIFNDALHKRIMANYQVGGTTNKSFAKQAEHFS